MGSPRNDIARSTRNSHDSESNQANSSVTPNFRIFGQVRSLDNSSELLKQFLEEQRETNKKLSRVITQQDHLENKFDNQCVKNTDEIEVLKHETSEIRRNLQRLDVLENTNELLHKELKFQYLIFAGVIEIENESDIILRKSISDIIFYICKRNIELDTLHRIGKANNYSPRNVRVRFFLTLNKRNGLIDEGVKFSIDWKTKSISSDNGYTYYIKDGEIIEEDNGDDDDMYFDVTNASTNRNFNQSEDRILGEEPARVTDLNFQNSQINASTDQIHSRSSQIPVNSEKQMVIQKSINSNSQPKPASSNFNNAGTKRHQPDYFSSISQHHHAKNPAKRQRVRYETDPNYMNRDNLRPKNAGRPQNQIGSKEFSSNRPQHLQTTKSSQKRKGYGLEVGPLNVLRLIAKFGIKFKHSVELHWYTAKETEEEGSRHVVKRYCDEDKKVAGMLNLDSLGYQNQTTGTGGRAIAGYVLSYWDEHHHLRTTDRKLTAFVKMLVGKGYPSAYVTEFDDNPYRHSTHDLISTVNFEMVNEFAKLGLAFLIELGAAD
ncbi:Leucine aminopeptidase 1 [Orchesella cincta]|uniref:Leucine aminopeptidase 1 n=1 Tax=Orchesella cincta TaxID=48709 RepID=A0A1D2MCE9_ORCCI|nr:Leucine aminopeptidase 1 [Orchesella cincta]